MLVSKHAAELCTLLVSDLYGELPSRILIALLTKGRSNVPQLTQHTSLAPKQVRHGLGVLLQQNLVYHEPSFEMSTTYDANPDACYNLVRSGKVLDMVERIFGSAEREVVQMLLLSGHAKIADLMSAFESRTTKSNGHTNGSHKAHPQGLESPEDLLHVLARLIQAEIIETVRPDNFRNPLDVHRDILGKLLRLNPGEKLSAKEKAERQLTAKERFRNFQEESSSLKRHLDQSGFGANKRRKLQNGHSHNGDEDNGLTPQLNPNIILRLNHERCNVELRNQQLANFVADRFGDVTADIYKTFLRLLTAQLSSCRPHPIVEEITVTPQLSVTTMEVYENLDPDLNVGSGIGKAPRDKLDHQSAERLRETVPDSDSDSEESDADAPTRPSRSVRLKNDDDDDSDESDDGVPKARGQRGGSKMNGSRETKVKFDDDADTRSSRIEQMRQHLLMLAESKHRLIRHSGTEGQGKWTVDFPQLMSRIRATEIDAVIEHSYGRHGLRLTRILREKGRLDEKMLPAAALMKKSEVQEKMLAMQMAGIVDIQEVPKDNTRVANRTLFFWFFDGERTEAQILDDFYKAMLRVLQLLQVERHRERNLLAFVERKDVQGQEQEVMTTEHYNKYNRHLEVQDKLLGQLMRLDDLVAVLRDY